MGIRDIVVLTFFVASVPFCFIRPFYGVLVWGIISFLNLTVLPGRRPRLSGCDDDWFAYSCGFSDLFPWLEGIAFA
jgi:hypothetical protein